MLKKEEGDIKEAVLEIMQEIEIEVKIEEIRKLGKDGRERFEITMIRLGKKIRRERFV